MPIEIITVLIATASGIAGYLFREYSSKAEPFFQILTINGSITRNDDDVSVTPKLISDLNDTFYLPSLNEAVKYGKIFDLYANINRLKRFSTDVKKAVDNVLLAKSDYEFVEALKQLFQFTYFDTWIYYLLYSEKIDLINISETEEKIKIFDDDSSNGSVYINFPQSTINFGQQLKAPVVRAKYKAFLDGVKYLDRLFLERALKSFKEHLERECHLADAVFSEVEDLTNNHSRWGVCAYIANLNNYPLVIEADAKIIIRDKKTGDFSEICELAIVKVSQDGSLSMTRTAKMPIVLRPSSSIQLGFITKKTQGDMPLGADIRAAFNRKQSNCQIEISVRKIGLLKRRTYTSAKAQFVETEI